MAHPEAPVQVLKITGLGRSGSTILDVVLGNHPKIESVGEVGNLMRNGWISHKSLRGIPEKSLRVPLCTCGKRLDVLYVDAPEKAWPVLVQGATRVGGAGRPPGRHRGLPEAPERLRARETMEPLRVGPVAAPAVPEARALRPVPLVRQADARVLRVHTRGERQARDRGPRQISGAHVRPLDGARHRPVRGPPGAQRQRSNNVS